LNHHPAEAVRPPARPDGSAIPPGLAVLGLLASLSEAPAVPIPRWWHWVLGLDHRGRLTLPPEARQLTARTRVVRASSRAGAVVLRPDGMGAATRVDRRGRVLLPAWLRRQVGPQAGAVFLAARRPDASIVVVTPVTGLDDVADALVGEVG
jgi:hypothetical protein